MIARILTIMMAAVVLCSCSAPRFVVYGQIGSENPARQGNYKIALRGNEWGPDLGLEDAFVFSDGAFRLRPFRFRTETVCFYGNDTLYAVYEFATGHGPGFDLLAHEIFSTQKIRLIWGDKARLEIGKAEYSQEQLDSASRLCDDIEKGKDSPSGSSREYTLVVESTRESGCDVKAEREPVWAGCGPGKKCYDEDRYYSCLDDASEDKLREYEAACKSCEPLPSRTWVNGMTIRHNCCPQTIRLDQEEEKRR